MARRLQKNPGLERQQGDFSRENDARQVARSDGSGCRHRGVRARFWVHDTGPRAMSPKVKGFVQAKNWFQDLTPVYMQ